VPATPSTPFFLANAASSSASANPLPSGHSQYTCLPASSAAFASSKWCGTFTVTVTISTSGDVTSSATLPKAREIPAAEAAASELARLVLATPAISKLSDKARSAGT
jgi:hypothetical protein